MTSVFGNSPYGDLLFYVIGAVCAAPYASKSVRSRLNPHMLCNKYFPFRLGAV